MLRRPPLHPRACVVADCLADPAHEIHFSNRSLLASLMPTNASTSFWVCERHRDYLMALMQRLA
jgi:hypothetical protein